MAAAIAAAWDSCVAGIGTSPAVEAVVAAPRYGDPYTYDCGTLENTNDENERAKRKSVNNFMALIIFITKQSMAKEKKMIKKKTSMSFD